MIYMFLSNNPSSGGYKFVEFVLFDLILYVPVNNLSVMFGQVFLG